MDWRLIFLQSPANDGWYDESALPLQVWAWPNDTWLKKRLRELREEGAAIPLRAHPHNETRADA